MQYNSEKEPVILKEYGRNIQNLVNYLKTVPDKKNRTELASQLIHMMRIVNPQRDSAENHQRAWDQVFVMANYEFDVDAPYSKPKPEGIYIKPEPIPYPKGTPRYKHFGRNLERIIASACELSDENLRKETALYIAKMMKTFYSSWIKELTNHSIAEAIFELSNGRLDVKKELSENPNLLGSQMINTTYPPTESELKNRNNRRKRKKNKNKQNHSLR